MENRYNYFGGVLRSVLAEDTSILEERIRKEIDAIKSVTNTFLLQEMFNISPYQNMNNTLMTFMVDETYQNVSYVYLSKGIETQIIDRLIVYG